MVFIYTAKKDLCLYFVIMFLMFLNELLTYVEGLLVNVLIFVFHLSCV